MKESEENRWKNVQENVPLEKTSLVNFEYVENFQIKNIIAVGSLVLIDM